MKTAAAAALVLFALVVLARLIYQYIECAQAGGELMRGLWGYRCVMP